MKLQAKQVDAFVAKPQAGMAAALLYGPDAGLVAERARKLGAGIAGSLDDPFRVSELEPDVLEREPGRLVEEAQALCMLGGRRLVRVRNATDKVTEAVRQLAALGDKAAGFVVIEAGELGGGSKLRRAVEQAKTAMALPCYRADERSMPAFVRETLGELGLKVEAEALSYLAQSLGGDRGVTRAELEKLALYVAPDPVGRTVRLEDAAAAVGDSGAVEVDDMVRAALTGDRTRLGRTLDRLLAEGSAPSMLLRACARTLTQVLRIKAEAAGGKPLSGLTAPLHFRQKELIEGLIRDWPADRLLKALGRLQEAELRCRRPRAPEALICREALTGLAG